MKRYDKAIQDFNVTVQLNPQCGLGYMGKADCLRFNGQFNEAISLYTQCLDKDEIIPQVLILKRAITYIEAKQYQQAKQDLQNIINEDPSNSEAYYFKGLLYYRQKNLNDAILSFEQAIKHNNSRKAVTKALYEITKIKIELRDYYQAFYTLTRADYLDVDKKALEKFRIFTDGVTFLMKRKYQEGIENLTNLVKNHALGDFLKPLVYTYRAYGYFCIGKHQKCLNDLQFVETFQKLDKPSLYNKHICEGIISSQNSQFEQAINFFNKANKISPLKMEPYFYKAMTLIKFTNKLIPKNDEQKRLQYKQNALKNIDKGIELNDQNANIYFHRGILKFSLNMVSQSLQDFEKAIEKSEDNQAKHYYSRGLAYACLNFHKQAISDLSACISLDQNHPNAYLNRAKCYHLIGEKNNAFIDLQKYVNIKPSDPNIHLYAGNLLFNIGAFDDAIKAYSHANNINKNSDILLLRAKCYMIFKELNSALEDMEKILELNENNKEIKFDLICLSSLKIASNYQTNEDQQQFQQSLQKIKEVGKKASKQEIQGVFFKKSDYLFFKGFYFFQLGDYKAALKLFQKSFEYKSEECEIKRKEKLQNQNISQLLDQELDEKDINQFISELEEYEFSNRTYNIYEFYFNIAVCYIMLQNYQEAFKYLAQLQEILPDQEKVKQIDILLQILNDEIEDNINATKNIDEQSMKRIYNIKFFPISNRLCSIFPSTKANFKIYKDFEFNIYFCLPSVESPSMMPCFDENLLESLQPTVVENKPEAPWIKKTAEGVIFTDNVQYFDDLDLKTETKRESVLQEEQNKEIMDLNQDFDINIKSSQKRKTKQSNAFDYDKLMFDHSHYLYNDYKDMDDSYEEIEENPQIIKQIDKNKLKEILKLDDEIEKKLAKLNKKN